MLPTPSTSHVCFDRVYEPAEDSFLFLDTLSSASEASFLKDRFRDAASASPLILEVGVGSGVILAFVAANASSIFGRHDVLAMGTDINPFACRAASQTAQDAVIGTEHGHGVFLDVLNGNLGSAIRSHTVDVFIFNPPYVPAELPDLSRHEQFKLDTGEVRTTSFEQDSYLLELSYAGGEDGMVITNRMLEQIPDLVSSDRGVAYVLFCAQNKPETVKKQIKSWGQGWDAEIIGSSGKKAGWEKLAIMRIWRSSK